MPNERKETSSSAHSNQLSIPWSALTTCPAVWLISVYASPLPSSLTYLLAMTQLPIPALTLNPSWFGQLWGDFQVNKSVQLCSQGLPHPFTPGCGPPRLPLKQCVVVHTYFVVAKWRHEWRNSVTFLSAKRFARGQPSCYDKSTCYNCLPGNRALLALMGEGEECLKNHFN